MRFAGGIPALFGCGDHPQVGTGLQVPYFKKEYLCGYLSCSPTCWLSMGVLYLRAPAIRERFKTTTAARVIHKTVAATTTQRGAAMTTTNTTIDSITNKVFRNVQEAFAALDNYRTCKDGDSAHVAEAYYELELAMARVKFLEEHTPEYLGRQLQLIEDNWKTPL